MTKNELSDQGRKPKELPVRCISVDNKADRTNKKFVGDCPFRFMRIDNPCSKIPASFLCGTPDCWAMAAKMKGIDWTHIRESDMAEFTEAVNMVKPEIIDRLLDAYLGQQNRSG